MPLPGPRQSQSAPAGFFDIRWKLDSFAIRNTPALIVMKALPLLSIGVSLLIGPVLRAQGLTPAPAKDGAAGDAKVKLDDAAKKDVGEAQPAAEVAPAQDLPGVEKLSEEQKKALVAGMGEVSNFLRGVRLLESLEKLNEIEAITGPNHYLENLRGAVYTKMRRFDKARDHFSKALELAKGLNAEAFHPRFNLAELDFVEKHWDAARDAFQKLLKDPGKPNTSSDTLINFKILICNLQQKKESEAELMMKDFDPYDADSPVYYYANAVKLFVKDDKDGANEWLESARRIYPKEVNEVYNDSLVEMGWLETLQ